MLKARDFIVIAILNIILFVFFLFFTPTMYSSDYRVDSEKVILRANFPDRVSESESVTMIAKGMENEIAVLGFRDQEATKTVTDTLMYMQIGFTVYDSIADVRQEKTAIVTTSDISDSDVLMLKEWLKNDKGVIFTVMPKDLSEVICDFLGIENHTPTYEAAGFTFYEGIFLGGLVHNGIYPLICRGIELDFRCRVFASGYGMELKEEIEEEPIHAEYPDKTPMIWRLVHEGGEVYVVNAPFMEDSKGSGVLAGILSLHLKDLIYPVVGTKTVALFNFPYLMGDILVDSRSSYLYTRDLIWPSLVSVAKNLNIAYTCYPSGDFYGGEDAFNNLEFMYDELYRLNFSELGCAPANQAMLDRNANFLQEVFGDIEFHSLLNASFEPSGHITAVSNSDGFDGFSWITNSAVNLPVTGSGVDLEEGSFAYESYVTAFGYGMHVVDMEPVYLNVATANEYMRDAGIKLFDYFSNRNYLAPHSAKDAAEQVKNYLNVNMAASYRPNGVSVALAGNDMPAKFILRTTKKIDEDGLDGCEIKEIYENVYLITAADDFAIRFLAED